MKRAANPGEGEIPIGASEIPGPMAYTDPETGERVIDVESTDEGWDSRALGSDDAHASVADPSHEVALNKALRLPKRPTSKRNRVAKG